MLIKELRCYFCSLMVCSLHGCLMSQRSWVHSLLLPALNQNTSSKHSKIKTILWKFSRFRKLCYEQAFIARECGPKVSGSRLRGEVETKRKCWTQKKSFNCLWGLINLLIKNWLQSQLVPWSLNAWAQWFVFLGKSAKKLSDVETRTKKKSFCSKEKKNRLFKFWRCFLNFDILLFLNVPLNFFMVFIHCWKKARASSCPFYTTQK